MQRLTPNIPLPECRFLPGLGLPKPHLAVGVYDRKTQFLYGTDLFNASFFWEAHEVWEHLWRQTSDPIDAAFLKSMIQFSAAMVQQFLKRPNSSKRLVKRALGYLSRVAETKAWPFGLDVCHWIRKWWQISAVSESSLNGKAPHVWIDPSRIIEVS